MPHRRSVKSLVRRYIYRISYRDIQLSETICLSSKHEVLDWVLSNIETPQGLNISDIPDVTKGLVLTDTRGTGAFQR